MKKSILIAVYIICSLKVFAQGTELAATFQVDLTTANHYEGYLENNITHEKIKIMWYPDVNGYRLCQHWDKLKSVPAGFTHIDMSCNCGEPNGRIGYGSASYMNIQFDFDSSVLRTSTYPILDATSADLRSSGGTIEIDGYASSEGTAAHNMELSKDRATSVKTYLVNSGVDAKRLKIKGFGETHPIANNETEEGRVLNRRVEFKRH